MRKFNKGDRVRKGTDPYIGIVVTVRERGVAGSAVTYTQYIEVEYENGIIIRGEPHCFEKVNEVES
jgi:hypothetical protein